MTPTQQGLDPQRSLPTPFLSKTYQLVDDRSIDDIISWNEDGSGFIVWNPTEFAGDLLPKYFKHNNFSSFVRQLNTYGFRKIMPDRWEFSNERFRRGEKRLLRDIQRRKITPPAATATPAVPAAAVTVTAAPVPLVGSRSPSDSAEEQVVSSNSPPVAVCRDHSSSSGCSTELTDENERLRRENMQLTWELSRMKSLCSNIYDLMSTYVSNRPENGSPAVTPLDLLTERHQQCENDVTADGTSRPVVESRSVAKSFGFPIGAKRLRECDDVDENFLELQLRLGGMEVKSEPSDEVNGGDDPDCTWVGRTSV